MRILQVNKYMKIVGGAETYMFNLASVLAKKGIEVEFWGMEDDNNKVPDTHNCFARGIDFKTTKGLKSKVKESTNVIYSKQNKRRLSIILDEFKPDIVHIHNFNFQLTPSILSEIKKRDIKIVYTIHDSQLACPNHRLYIPHKNKVCTKCLHGKYYHASINKCFDQSFSKSVIGMAESYLHHNILNSYNKYFDAIISPSNFFKNIIQPKLDKEITRLPYCVPKQDFKTITERKDYVLYFGRVSKEKGLEKIVDLFNKMNYKLKVVGKGDLAIQPSDNIEVLGPKYGSELIDLVANAKFTIHPSIWYDNFPMSVLESLMLGTPVIASNHSGFQEMANDVNGYLVDFKSDEIYDELKRIVLENKYLDNEQIAIEAEKKYNEEDHFVKISKIYNDLLC
ncbi:glycosyltransferase family 4 protein [Spongiivirga citrea]|uniref:Glycosyltransferase n=1 Tax=Spongiivirga citrea TaxID=1481457 RepID=A0A6M0CYS6_9FLAO|nr:glycosyltransferase family 4 protein [Spongiivirga citrea]NER18910.1 glycosyltransferase [Spongiivirga citrea]